MIKEVADSIFPYVWPEGMTSSEGPLFELPTAWAPPLAFLVNITALTAFGTRIVAAEVGTRWSGREWSIEEGAPLPSSDRQTLCVLLLDVLTMLHDKWGTDADAVSGYFRGLAETVGTKTLTPEHQARSLMRHAILNEVDIQVDQVLDAVFEGAPKNETAVEATARPTSNG